MKLINNKYISWLLVIVVIGLFTWYFAVNIDDFKILLDINPAFVVLLAIFNIIAIVINGIFMKLSVSLFGKNISTNESVRVSLISSAGNFFAPAGSGLGFRAIYLKKRHELSYSDYISIVFCNYVVVFFVSAIIGLLSLLMLNGSPANAEFLALYMFFGALLVLSVAMFFIRADRIAILAKVKMKFVSKITDILLRVSAGWRLLLGEKQTMAALVSLVLANAGLMVVTSYLVMSSLNIYVSFGGLVLYSILGSLSLFINITPGNLGVKEAIYVVFSSIIGLTTAQILSVAIVERAVIFFVLFILWARYGKSFTHKLKNEA